MWTQRRRDPVEAQADELVLECELLLTGRYAPFVRAQERAVPAWAWAGVLAHGTADDLKAWATIDALGRRSSGEDREWRQSISFLAEDILNYVRATGVSLDEVQRTALVPLELWLMKQGDDIPIRAGQLAGLVLASVHSHPSRPQR